MSSGLLSRSPLSPNGRGVGGIITKVSAHGILECAEVTSATTTERALEFMVLLFSSLECFSFFFLFSASLSSSLFSLSSSSSSASAFLFLIWSMNDSIFSSSSLSFSSSSDSFCSVLLSSLPSSSSSSEDPSRTSSSNSTSSSFLLNDAKRPLRFFVIVFRRSMAFLFNSIAFSLPVSSSESDMAAMSSQVISSASPPFFFSAESLTTFFCDCFCRGLLLLFAMVIE
mmetsp:Transcript_27821/g.61270  ORF Transcript_27821/g.61270 Transcript_27821/m.61270 type:complete len:227 (+) Transcript_27821:665-1345(+)